ncbi:flagellar biosynthetic protein FliO [Metasolibacillus fluoroglycofenilyticus]|uniref:flagellar biosynthetic protein FliO n=1 Tax=Metasolibacillus fluoroglycofenilyticus TaxID=1239396 RepID=UPI000D37E794|nr:flagellar biosynthetic protein FliO [Metasolibacillus fluoroglycofenilyticus]
MLKNKSLHAYFFVMLLVLIAVFSPTEAYAAQDGYVIDHLKNSPSSDDIDAETDAATDENAPASGSFSLWSYMKVLFALILVLALLIGVLRFLNKRNVKYQQNSVVRNVGGLSVGAQKSVQIIQVGNHLYMIGVGDNVQLLKELSDEEEIEQILAQYEDKQLTMPTVPHIVELFTKKSEQKQKTEQQVESFGNIFDKRLSEIKKERSNGLEQWKEKEHDKQ